MKENCRGLTRRVFVKGVGAASVAAMSGPFLRGQDKSGSKRLVLGGGEHRYECIHDWLAPPKGIKWGDTHGLCQDASGRIHVAHTVHKSSERGDAVVVFDRRADGEVLEFGVSGLLYNSNLLMYDRRPDAAGESLWCQLLCRAVTGPRADSRLTVLNATVTEWGRWFANHPGTTVLRREPRLAKRYQETSYDSYFRSAKLMFPVNPAAPADGPGPKDRLIVVDAGGQRGVFLTEQVRRRTGAAGATGTSGSWQTRLNDTTLLFKARPGSRSVTVTTVPPGRPITTIHALWFAWHSMYPQEQPIGAGVDAP